MRTSTDARDQARVFVAMEASPAALPALAVPPARCQHARK
jgi:hypothetical protein